MAQQHGPIQIKGTIGQITFFRNIDGTYGAKQKTTMTKERIENDPKFARTRENGMEFGTAGKSGKVFRDAFQSLNKVADPRMIGRLQKRMMACLQADTTSLRGARKVSLGTPLALVGFEFNVNGKLSATMKAPYTTNVNRTTGALSITIPPFIPTETLSIPGGATHFRFVAAGAEVDFDNYTCVSDKDESAYLTVDNAATTSLTLTNTVTANSTAAIYQALAIHFYQEVNGVKYALNTGATDAAMVVNADV
jgi:hypothetical protein